MAKTLPLYVARRVFRTSIIKCTGVSPGTGVVVTQTLRDFGFGSKTAVENFKKIAIGELMKVAPAEADVGVFEREFAIKPSSTVAYTIGQLQRAYALGLGGDPMPPPDDD